MAKNVQEKQEIDPVQAAIALLASLPKEKIAEAKKEITKLSSPVKEKKKIDKTEVRKIREKVEAWLVQEGYAGFNPEGELDPVKGITIAHLHIHGGNPDKPKAAKQNDFKKGWYYFNDDGWKYVKNRTRWTKALDFNKLDFSNNEENDKPKQAPKK